MASGLETWTLLEFPVPAGGHGLCCGLCVFTPGLLTGYLRWVYTGLLIPFSNYNVHDQNRVPAWEAKSEESLKPRSRSAQEIT